MDMMSPPPQAGPADDEEGSGIGRSRSRWRWVGTAVSVLLFAISLIVLWQILSQVKFEDVTGAFAGKAREQLALAFFFTIVSYTLLTGYDALALHQMRARIPYRTTALASFTSYAISFTLGFPLFTAGAVRYWIYAPRGLPASKVAGLTLIAGSTFLLGMGAVVGFGLVFRAEALAEINRLAVSVNRLIGLAVLGAITAYIVYSFLGRRRIRIGRWRLELPSFRVSLGQILLGVGDVCCAATVLYVLLPAGYAVDFGTFAAVFAFACILGMVSHAPGGLGVFEATILLAFWRLPYEGLIGALLLFRICYYLVPFIVALLVLGGREIALRVRAFRARVEQDTVRED